MNQPGIETIRDILSNYPQETLADALSIIFTETNPESPSKTQSALPVFANFAQVILYLKKHTHFPELDLFTTEADLVYVQAGDRRFLITDKNAASVLQNRPQNQENEAKPAQTLTPEDAFENKRFSNLEF